ncbi:dnpp-1 [Pristionchus pacificus]|uniref:Aspartyl aminopeptidase n=1 Tax=Pristionchus pacificus TaxID=54126 RepID=A0A8R1Z9P5_PRIPA|nr:dnpp-1 [Pristionchus pacificus]
MKLKATPSQPKASPSPSRQVSLLSPVRRAARSLTKCLRSQQEDEMVQPSSLLRSKLPTAEEMAGPASVEVRKAATEFISFLNKSVTPFHAVQECVTRLKAAGFEELKECDQWTVQPKKKYFVTKNRSCILAFAVGGAYKPGNGFSVVVGHTDSPCLRVKPISRQQGDKFIQVGVSTYGGGIWRTWFDRDLSLAGEVALKKDNKLVRKLINIARPVMCIPNLAIHLETDRTKFECNNETNLRPILESFAAAGLDGAGPKKPETPSCDPRDISGEHHSAFLELLCEAVGDGCKATDLVDLDLYLYDAQPAAITGLKEEFISGARLDNLVGTYTAVTGLINSLDDDAAFSSCPNVRVAACYDNEEVGSQSAQGAETAFTEHVLRKLAAGGSTTEFECAIGRSMLISADQAHAAHPNYSAKHEENHRPAFHGGVVVKVNHNQRYATTMTTHAVLKQIAYEAGVPLQKMIVRNDSPCGSTVGPILSSRLGLATIDVGCPQLAMHSIREFGDTSSILQAQTLYTTFFKRLHDVLEPML